MSDPTPQDLERIHAIVDQFEDDWNRGVRPGIASYLEGELLPFRADLVWHLLGVELELRRKHGETPEPADYEALMPEWAGLIRDVFEEQGRTRTPNPSLSSATALESDPAPPALPGFEIQTELGRGGMGVVYRAWQGSLKRPVALKMMKHGDSSERLRREARLIAQINSPHVVHVHDLYTLSDGRLVLVMEYIEGTDLARLMKLRSGPLPQEEVVPWMRQVADGMRAAAERKIIHRDLKPSNILIDETGRARVADFGLSRGPAHGEELTRSNAVVGTPYYMAPEQAEDPQSVDTRADLYSFGATFYHALTGVPPFDGKTPFAILYKHKAEPLIPSSTRNPDVPEWVCNLLEICLAKSPSARFGSFGELLQYLRLAPDGRSPMIMADEATWNAHLEKFRTRRLAYLAGPPEAGECDRYEFSGGRVLRIIRGDIVAQGVDAIVNSEECALPMNYGVSLALRLAAGDEVARAARKYALVQPGRVVVTMAGRLHARFLFHGVTMGYLDNGWTMPTRELIQEIIAGCLYHADSLNVRSIAFPLLGTGAGGFSREVCLETMFRYIGTSLRRRQSRVQDVRVVIYPLERS
jgi:serine/threonine protein kinase/O-acetyl-ADP-ribose deacetylase (regulator of RNase III)